MKCAINTTNSNLSFGTIHYVANSKLFLENTLNRTEKAELKTLIQKQKENPVNITLARYKDKYLCGWTIHTEKTSYTGCRRGYAQKPIFESPIDFIKRLCKKADNINKKYGDNLRKVTRKDLELNL